MNQTKSNDIINITSSELKTYMDTHHEREYVILDVRQPEEYHEQHIPGARLVPYPTLGTNIDVLPENVDIIFSCRSGARSKAAAALTLGSGKNIRTVYNLLGGILAWGGKTIHDFPRIQVLGPKNDFVEMLLSAMDLEKGAWIFYTTLLERFPNEPFSTAIHDLSLAESEHAEALYRILGTRKNNLPEFTDMFNSLKGDILEGGIELKDALAMLDKLNPSQPLSILDFALDIEYSAFDLYRSGADLVDDPDIKKILYGIANGEKQHMKILAKAFQYLEK